ncbi:hypothetical protein OJAV_G00130080 [Oryzias javanicus]|uniref:Galaxin-like repeats domain-containing protein n=1 Tax=Oryzias javanicus TaxID=123683 RepID=A0A437CPW6_ORYJA|nr:hypothetical protein OJAV_G00130080 [Oryzias javanicus]
MRAKMVRDQWMLCLVCGFFTLCGILLEAQASCESRHQALCLNGRKGSLHPANQFTNCVSEEFAYCGGCVYSRLNEICCNNSIRNKPAAMAQCCGKDPFDVSSQLCCGPVNDKKILNRISVHHLCCGHEQFNKQTQCCSDDLKVENHTNCDNKTTGKTSVKKQCGTNAFDESSQLCCGPVNDKKILNRISVHHLCCGHEQFNNQTQCCSDDLKVENHTNCDNKTTGRTSVKKQCGTNPFDESSQLCCGPVNDKKILNRISVHHLCCGHEQFNKQTQCCSDDLKVENHTNCDNKTTGRTSVMEQCDSGLYNKTKELCCGPHGSKIILNKISKNHSCCGHNQYNTKTQRCTDELKVYNFSSENLSQNACVPLEIKRSNPNCFRIGLFGSNCNKPNRCSCCERLQTKLLHCLSGRQCKSTGYNPKQKICRKPWMDQCCGDTPFGSEQPGVLCCDKTLHKDVQGQHCCGSSVYDPEKQICCNGHSYPKTFFHCCGESAYNISDPLKKCCGGTLYNLTKEQSNDTQCCGSLLKSKEEVCCSSEDKVMMYCAGEDFKCCGHHYYNTSLWSCHRGRLSPGQSANSAESTLLSINNLDETQLCKQIYFGAVQSVSPNSTVFSSVLKIHGERATVHHHVGPFIVTNNGMILRLTLGKWHFFNNSHVFTDFNHESLQQSLFFILSKCSKNQVEETPDTGIRQQH